ncbi:MAG: CDP-alcohol phosphatidyltransferase family protein [Actinobacteria bacterium]|nr:CDP-alcohol phosphatidyltransferase family protein [Actinomycetota bacterium]
MRIETFYEKWSELHGSAQVKGVVKVWLTLSYWLSRPLVALLITPNALSYISILAGGTFLLSAKSNWAILLLVLSLLLDGIDGSVAILGDKTTKYGALLDSVADRIVEAFWILGLYVMGAPWQPLFVIWLASYIQEYMRARSSSLGVTEILLVTWSERPVRASLIFIALIARAFEIQVLDFTTGVTYLLLILQVSSSIRLFLALRLHLRQSLR